MWRSTPDNDAEYLKFVADKEGIEKRLEFATGQLLAEEDRDKRRWEAKQKEEGDQRKEGEKS